MEGEDNEEESGFRYYFGLLDKTILRPIFIYKYNKEAIERQE